MADGRDIAQEPTSPRRRCGSRLAPPASWKLFIANDLGSTRVARSGPDELCQAVTRCLNTVATVHRSNTSLGDSPSGGLLSSLDATPTDQAPPLIVIANDQEWTARAVETILAAAGYQVMHAYTAGTVLRVVAETDPDLVILDQQLPDFSGTDVCRQLRANPRFGPSLPIIITTAGPSGRPQRLNAYAAGAWEFYGQPLDAEALLHKIDIYLAAYRETRRLRRGAMIDDATGLYSRFGLAVRATELIAEARRLGRAFACVAWSIRDSESADRLRVAVPAFKASGRATDALGQLGDSTLAVIAPGTNADDAVRLADRLGKVISGAAGLGAGQLRATVVAGTHPEALPSNGEQLVDQVTLALAS